MADDPKLQMTLGQALLLMNAWRRLTAFIAMTANPTAPVQVATAIGELLEPAVRDLGDLADQLPADQLSATLHAPSAWLPNFPRAKAVRSGHRGRQRPDDPAIRTRRSRKTLPD